MIASQVEPCTDVKAFIQWLCDPSQVFEIRAPKCPDRPGGNYKPTFSSYFDDAESAADFIRKGAAALGVGSSLVNQKLLDDGDLETLTHRAEAFISEVKKGRAK